ncbi:MAG: hypothetical protein COV52_10285 [Gammaproteobacteria bacterium CG11_big_fil_rev_8_21_14_0_20_46_22]|nr:MAG: hypothetical protein COW05_09510 [Gammaproteobacteria bacterium CG12_big_fil_rev_8_21_14_0_65_46_12]PIR10084.1 MAG: hypothetical protein COV52_10285 [Gammaproteobacteria bacterium CG11_big_fil_rev_8_21_14_0_20_46_22]
MKYDLDRLLPQKPPMRLLDEVLEIGESTITAKASVTSEHLFFDPVRQSVPAHVGVEMMAQAMSAFASAQGGHDEPRLGFLISVRQFSSTVSEFACGDELLIRAEKVLMDDQMAVFSCEIYCDNDCLAKAKLSAYQPDDKGLAVLMTGEHTR